MALIQLMTIISFFGLWLQLILNSQNFIFKKKCIFLKAGEHSDFPPWGPSQCESGHSLSSGARALTATVIDPSGLGPEAASLSCSIGLAFEGENSTLLLAPWSHRHFQSLSHPTQPPIFSHEPLFLCFRKK